MTNSSRGLAGPALAAGLLLATAAVPGRAEKAVPRGTAATCVSVRGALLRRDDPRGWRPIRPGDAVRAGDRLVALPRAELRSRDGAVRLVLLADVGKHGPFPVLETAVRLQPAGRQDLDVTLDRGVLRLTNLKKEGAAHVRVRFRGAAWDLTLEEPGARVGLELYARHPPGLPVLTRGKVGEPTAEVFLLVFRGPVFLDAGTEGLRLLTPPGPALVHWDSASRQFQVRRLEKPPEGAGVVHGEAPAALAAVAAAAGRLNNGPIGPALDGLLHGGDKVGRLVGVTAAGALDDLPRLVQALADPRHADVREQAVLVLRHWLGKRPGQAMRLYDFLKAQAGYPATRARTVVQLLFGFGKEARARPDTYALLLDLLRHGSLPVRELAHWHLVRLVRAGRDIPYDAAAPPEQRARAYQQWRALLPPGRLPAGDKGPPPKNP